MAEWVIIYHDGIELSYVKSTQLTWNDAPTNNVQIVMLRRTMNHYHAIHGLDEYTLETCPGSETKFGKLITEEQWKEVRNFMVGMAWRN